MIKAVRTALAGTVVALGLLLASASPASAGFTIDDHIEPSFNTWSFAAIGAGSSAGYTSVGPRSGVQAIKLVGKAPGYALARRTVFIGTQDVCAASIFVDPLGSSVPTPVNLEIVDPSTNGYIALKTMTLASNAGYTQINLAFVTQKQNIDVRVAVGTSVAGASVAANVDDLSLTCH